MDLKYLPASIVTKTRKKLSGGEQVYVNVLKYLPASKVT